MNRLLLYVHFNKYDIVSPHVKYQLEKVRPLFSKIVFISNSAVNQEEVEQLKKKHMIDVFLQRENKGFDFAAWRDGLSLVGYESLVEYDSVTMMNDTCFGPLWDLESYYKRFESDENVDFWGMTNHRAGDVLPEHIQSYFVVYKKKLATSSTFKNYWSTIKDFSDVQDVIDNYEAQTTSIFLEAGFQYGVVFDTVEVPVHNNLPPNFSLYHPTALLEAKVPFFKVKIPEANNSIAPYLLDYIERKTDYPIDVMIHHLSDTYMPDNPYKLGKKYLKEKSLIKVEKKIAIHLHVYYTDLLGEFLRALESCHFDYDLFITTDSEEKRTEIENQLTQENAKASIYVFDNIGRDIIPMLRLGDVLSKYDYIGHFHTKKSKEADFWAGESWRHELIESMILPADTIISQLEAETLGLVIADIPTFFRYNKIVDAGNEALIAPAMNQLWSSMGLNKAIDFENFHTFVMSYGTFVWFKYDALKPLFDLKIDLETIPKEPLPQNSVLHAMERLLVYIAWDRHYDFRISPTPVALTPFIDNKLLNHKPVVAVPQTFADFNQSGGFKSALRYWYQANVNSAKFVTKKVIKKLKK